MKIGIIGGGSMGTAFARGLLKKHLVTRNDLLIVEADAGQRAKVAHSLGCLIQPSCAEALSSCSPIILSVKPQDMHDACSHLRPYVHSGQLIISVMAGIPIAAISQALRGHVDIVRCMPNLPAQLDMGITPYVLGPSVTQADGELAKKVLEAIGVAMRVDSEDLINSATAISGTGPGYLFYFIEQLMQASVELGFTEEQSRHLILETLRGSVELWGASHHTAKTLREMVTSKGGTTAAAIEVFEAGKWAETTRAAVKRAFDRAVELAKK